MHWLIPLLLEASVCRSVHAPEVDVTLLRQVAASSQVSAFGQLAPSMHSRLLVSGLPRSLSPLPCSLAPPCLPCIEGRQRAAPHSSSFPPTTAPLQPLHMDVWGPVPIHGTDQERYSLLVIDEYTRYTMVFLLHSKMDVRCVLIPWIVATCHQLRERFRRDLPVVRLHSDRGGEFSSGLLAEFCRDEGIVHTDLAHTLLDEKGWQCVSVSGLGRALPCSRYHREQALSLHSPLRPPGLPRRRPAMAVLQPLLVSESPPPPQLDPLPPRGPAPSGVSQVGPPPLVEPLVISSDTSGPANGGDPTADNTATTRCSPCLETPPGFPPRPSSPPLKPIIVDTGAARGGDCGGEDAGGAGSGGEGSGGANSGSADSGGADSKGAASPSGGGAKGAPTAGLGEG
ncbi:unnamed protein product [Closterium sp. NIES-53]